MMTTAPVPLATTGHEECFPGEVPFGIGLRHILDIPAGLRDDLDAGRRDGGLQRTGDGPANQHDCPRLYQTRYPFRYGIHIARQVPDRLCASVLDLKDP